MSSVPWKRAQASQRARRSEERGARDQGGQRQPGSGAFVGKKGDIRDADWLIEDKYTDAASYTIKLSTFDKILSEALQMHGRLAMMRITIRGRRFRLMREEDYLHMKAQLDNDQA